MAETRMRAHLVFLLVSVFGAGELKALREEGGGPSPPAARLDTGHIANPESPLALEAVRGAQRGWRSRRRRCLGVSVGGDGSWKRTGWRREECSRLNQLQAPEPMVPTGGLSLGLSAGDLCASAPHPPKPSISPIKQTNLDQVDRDGGAPLATWNVRSSV